jgi:hypothetical protein
MQDSGGKVRKKEPLGRPGRGWDDSNLDLRDIGGNDMG